MSSPDRDPKKSILEKTKLKKFEERKRELLKDFQPTPGSDKRRLSPTTENLIKTLKSIGNQESSHIVVGHEVLYDSSKRLIIGKKPCARDGHTANVHGDRMLVFGGDRHLMCFCDLYYFDLA